MQFFADIKEKEFFLTEAEAHHAAAVARHKEGDEIRVFNGTGKQFMARIDRIQKNFVRGTLLTPCEIRRVPLQLTLCFVPNSRTGLEEVLDKGTQLGVACFQPLASDRSEYDILKKWDGKNDRWHQIMLSACKQCNTPILPQILPPLKFSQAIRTKIITSVLYFDESAAVSFMAGNSPTNILCLEKFFAQIVFSDNLCAGEKFPDMILVCGRVTSCQN